MSKNFKQLTITNKFIEEQLEFQEVKTLNNNEDYQDLVYHFSNTQPQAKAYYVKASMPYNTYISTAFLFKIRDTEEGVEDSETLNFESDTHQVIKYAEAPYLKSATVESINFITVGYTVDNIRRYQGYTYNQLLNETGVYFSEEDFNNVQEENSSVRDIIKTYIKSSFDGTAKDFNFDMQKLDNSSIDGSEKYIVFDFIFISKIPWNEFICCYDRNSYDQYVAGGRILNKNDENIYVHVYPFIDNSDLIERGENFGEERIFHSSSGDVDKITLKVYNSENEEQSGIPFYVNGQSLKIGPSKQYTLTGIPIYNFGIPNENEYQCFIEYEYDDE